ncbi:MAG: peroxiredoxin [Verrucomicrobiota bacterium JB022]|nr:peroxiredoxin [Verrucomicrobiota bacterium JB022]
MLKAEPLSKGAEAPALQVTTHEGKTLDLAEAYAEGPVLVYFYPKADTPGCTAQACNLRDHFEAVKDAGITVIGVSADGVDAQKAFAEKYHLPFTLVADHDKKLGKAFGVDSIMGRVFSRQSFLVVDGKVVWSDLKATPDSQAQDAVAALESYRKEHHS